MPPKCQDIQTNVSKSLLASRYLLLALKSLKYRFEPWLDFFRRCDWHNNEETFKILTPLLGSVFAHNPPSLSIIFWEVRINRVAWRFRERKSVCVCVCGRERKRENGRCICIEYNIPEKNSRGTTQRKSVCQAKEREREVVVRKCVCVCVCVCACVCMGGCACESLCECLLLPSCQWQVLTINFWGA